MLLYILDILDVKYYIFVLRAPVNEKWNESGFRPLLCTYRLNWARRTSWGWWDEWDDTSLQTWDLKFKPRRLGPSRLPLGQGGFTQHGVLQVDGEETFLFLSNHRDRKTSPNSSVKGSGTNHYHYHYHYPCTCSPLCCLLRIFFIW